jgi:hypothetical protein
MGVHRKVGAEPAGKDTEHHGAGNATGEPKDPRPLSGHRFFPIPERMTETRRHHPIQSGAPQTHVFPEGDRQPPGTAFPRSEPHRSVDDIKQKT